MDINRFRKKPVMGILRGIEESAVEPLVEAVVSAGLETIEITMNTIKAAKLIKRMIKKAGGRLIIGAGTVLNLDDLKSALDAGAEFIVSPVLIPEVAKYCVNKKVPVFPGALTPQEIYRAWCAGAAMVKVFPAKFFGPDYFKEIKAPFKKIELLACGGVNPQNIQSFFDCGASAIAFGSSIFKQEWLEKKDFGSISVSIKELLSGLN